MLFERFTRPEDQKNYRKMNHTHLFLFFPKTPLLPKGTTDQYSLFAQGRLARENATMYLYFGKGAFEPEHTRVLRRGSLSSD